MQNYLDNFTENLSECSRIYDFLGFGDLIVIKVANVGELKKRIKTYYTGAKIEQMPHLKKIFNKDVDSYVITFEGRTYCFISYY